MVMKNNMLPTSHSDFAARSGGLIVPPAPDLRVGVINGKLFFRTGARGCTNSYHVQLWPDHEQRMRYTLSQICQSQQNASKLIDFAMSLLADNKRGEYIAATVLSGHPETIDPYEASPYAQDIE